MVTGTEGTEGSEDSDRRLAYGIALLATGLSIMIGVAILAVLIAIRMKVMKGKTLMKSSQISRWFD